MEPSTFTECHLLLAVMNEDYSTAQELLDSLNASEQAELFKAVRNIRAALIDGKIIDPQLAPPPFVRALHAGGAT